MHMIFGPCNQTSIGQIIFRTFAAFNLFLPGGKGSFNNYVTLIWQVGQVQFVTKRYEKFIGRQVKQLRNAIKKFQKNIYQDKTDCPLKDVCVDSKNCANYTLHTNNNLFERVEKQVPRYSIMAIFGHILTKKVKPSKSRSR